MEGARAATEEDLPRLAELAAEAVAELAPTRGGGIWAEREARPLPAAESLAKAVADPHQHVIAGVIDDIVVGYATLRLDDLRNGQTLGVIDDIYVEAPARGVGVGEALMEAALEWCRQHGCAGVDALALPGNRETKNFFESFGLRARAIIVHRELDTGPQG